MPLSDGLTLLGSIVAGIVTILAAYVTAIDARRNRKRQM